MSITGSLVGYENNNDIAKSSNSSSNSSNKKKRRSILLNSNNNSSNHIAGSLPQHTSYTSMGKHCPPSLNSSISNSVITNASSGHHQHHQHHQYNSHHSQHHQKQQQQQHNHNHNHNQHNHQSAPLQQQPFPQQYMNSKRKHANNYHNMLMHPGAHLDHSNYLHLNSLWSIWYGVLLTLFQGYLAVHGAYRFLGCSLIPWKIEPVAELNLQIVLSGVVFILLPLFFTSAVFKVGNLANDGIKLATGTKERRCSMSPHDGLEEESRGGTLRALWTHGGPTAAFVHIVIAMCLLLPRLLLEARIIENGLLPRENIWQTELDFIAVNRRNLVVLSVVTSPYQNISNIDDEEDYYNDTMFTVGSSSSSSSNSNINNNLLDMNMGKAGNAATAAGKTRFFEVPDLINRESNEDADDNNNNNNNNSEYNASVGGGGGGGRNTNIVEHTDVVGGEEHISVEQFDSKEFVPQISTATTTTMATTTTLKATTTTITTPSSSVATATTIINNNNNRAAMNKNYDKSWDKLGTLGKGNSLPVAEKDVQQAMKVEEETANVADTIMTTTRGNGMRATATTTTGKTTGTSPTTTVAGTTTKATTTTTTTLTTTRKSAKMSASKLTTKTATRATTVASDVSSTAIPTIARTQPTRTHHQHQQHNHKHQQQQQQQHHGKSTRKQHHNNSGNGNGNNRQHHRQRNQQQQHHRRHHNNNNNNNNSNNNSNNANTSSGGRSVEGRNSRAELRPSKAVDFNRLDELELESAVLEHSTSSKTSHVSATSVEDALDYGRPALAPKTTAIISTTTRDSNIHIVKPEKMPEIIPSTPVTSNSKIIEIKTKGKRAKRMADDELQVEIEPEYLIGDLPANDSSEYLGGTSAVVNSAEDTNTYTNVNSQPKTPNEPGLVRLDGFAGMLQIFFGIEKPIDAGVFDRPPSAEFINLLFALLVWCVRYPAVFWTTTKTFATIFSIQIIAAALDIVFSYIGVANLYKLQVYSEAMPIQNPGLILNGVVTLALFLLSSVLMVASSMIMYLYGHGRLAAKMRDRSLITLKSSETWIYFAHCASLCYVLALAVVKAPLLNDLSATYRSNLHCPTFLSALISVVHLLLWIVIWLGLTAKRRWTFKLPPMDTYGLGKATTQPLLMANRGSLPSAGSGSGSGSGSVLAADQKCGAGGGAGGHISNASSVDGGVDDVYWPKLAPSSPKLKVTFNEVTSTCEDVLLIGDHEQNDGKRNSPRGTAVCFTSATGEIDDGEYATLRAATAASVVGISMGSMNGGTGGGGGGGGTNGTTPTGSLSIMSGIRVLHLSEYDELPPPPPPQLISTDVGGNPIGAPASTASIYQSQLTLVGDYVNCGGSIIGLGDDNTSEEGKLLACVRDDSVTYASTRDLEPPQPATTAPPPPPPPPPTCAQSEQQSPVKSVCGAAGVVGGRAPQAVPENMQLSSSPEHLVSPLAPVTVTVHTNEAHIASSSTPRCLRRADSGVPNEALTPRSDTTSTTESTTSPPERAPSESSSGVHSGEERDVEVVIRPRAACKPPPKPPQPPIQEEPYGRCTNMRMSSFAAEPTRNSNSATLPLTRSTPEQKFDYATHCSTMPLPMCHSQQQQQQNAIAAAGSRGSGNYAVTSAHSMQQQPLPSVSSFRSQYANSAVAMAGANAARLQQHQQQQHQQQQQLQIQQSAASMHTTLPNGVRYSNPHFLRRLPHVTKAAESPYGHLGLGAGHHTFSKLLQDPLQHSLVNTTIPEDRDSANYSMSSDQDCNMYATAQQLN